MTPRVSVCVPAYEAGEHLQETLDSIWDQDFDDFEVIVVDDASTDETPEILARQKDSRLLVARNSVNRGQARTFSEAVARSSGEFIKPLDADDLLRGDCLRVMVDALAAHPDAVFAFSRRKVLAEQPHDHFTSQWLAELGDLQAGTGVVPGVNDGPELLRQYLEAGMPGNWIAEPAGAIIRRTPLIEVGGFSNRVRQDIDMDLWLRLLTRGPAVYIDEPLYTYRFALRGVTGSSVDGETHWLDRLWMAEGLLRIDGQIGRSAVLAARRRVAGVALRRVLKSPVREPRTAPTRVRDLAAYGRFRIAALLGRQSPLYEPIEIRADP